MGLIIESHGASGYQKPANSSQERIEYACPVIQDGEKINVNLVDRGHVEAAFGPILGKFTSDSKIIFSGCNVIEVGKNFEEKAKILKKVADNFELTNGSIYASEDVSGELLRGFFAQPAITQGSSSRMNFARCTTQILAPLSLPVLAAKQWMANDGYLIRVTAQSDGTKIYQLYQDRFTNARNNRMPSGKLHFTFTEKNTSKLADTIPEDEVLTEPEKEDTHQRNKR